MINIKPGQILKYKNGEGGAKLLTILRGEGEVLYGVSYHRDHSVFHKLYNESELRNLFIIPEAKWTPEVGDGYWVVDLRSKEGVIEYTYSDDSIDRVNIANDNCFRTKQEALVALEKVKKALAN